MKLPVPARPLARPFTAALQRVLDRPADAVLRDYADFQVAWPRQLEAAQRGDPPPLTGVKVIDALAATMAAKAILGDNSLLAQIGDRLEGRPAVRSGESDVDEGAHAEMVANIEAAVRAMNRRPGDDARPIEVEQIDAKPIGVKVER